MGGSPFRDCVADRPIPRFANDSGEVEPTIAVDPNDAERIAVGWQQDRWFDGASRGIVVAVTADGGSTWRQGGQTKLSVCSGGTTTNGGGYPRVTDPWLTFGADGALHLMALAVHLDREASVGANREAILVTTSRDDGATWSDPATLVRDVDPGIYNDKPSITSDPTDPNTVYAVWHRLVDTPGGSVNGDTRFARSDDGGATWSRPRTILGPLRKAQSFGNEIVALPRADKAGSELVNVFSVISHRRPGAKEQVRVAAMYSDDRGRTWSDPIAISDIRAAPVRAPGTRQELKTGRLLPRVAVDPGSGNLYVAWSESSFGAGGYNDVAVSVSLDAARSWTPPVRVNQTPEIASAPARQTFTPEIAITADGAVGVSYYDFRNSGGRFGRSQPLPTDLFLVWCEQPVAEEDDRCAGSWTEVRLTETSFDLRMAPDSAGPFLGDYIGLSGAGGDVVGAFPQAGDEADPSSIFVRKMAPPTAEE